MCLLRVDWVECSPAVRFSSVLNSSFLSCLLEPLILLLCPIISLKLHELLNSRLLFWFLQEFGYESTYRTFQAAQEGVYAIDTDLGVMPYVSEKLNMSASNNLIFIFCLLRMYVVIMLLLTFLALLYQAKILIKQSIGIKHFFPVALYCFKVFISTCKLEVHQLLED